MQEGKRPCLEPNHSGVQLKSASAKPPGLTLRAPIYDQDTDGRRGFRPLKVSGASDAACFLAPSCRFMKRQPLQTTLSLPHTHLHDPTESQTDLIFGSPLRSAHSPRRAVASNSWREASPSTSARRGVRPTRPSEASNQPSVSSKWVITAVAGW